MNYSFAAEIIHDKEINKYIGFVAGLPGAHTQAECLDELYRNLQEVIALCLEEMTVEEISRLPRFMGTQIISVAL
jgi:predicted RNase H-like HicB family nuclease